MFFYSESDFNLPVVLNLQDLKKKQDIKFFFMEQETKPSKEELEKLCIEIASRTPDVEDSKDGRLNPYVGALLIKKEEGKFKIYGGCRSALHNGEHGECGLLTNILGRYIVEGCEMFVSLEPCTQESRHEWTEPCCEIIRNRRISKVTIGMLDPNPDVAGHGIRYLISHDVEVELFSPAGQKQVLKQNKDFSNQFGEDGDPRLNRKISMIINKYISENAVDKFIEKCHAELEIPFNQNDKANNRHHFYQKMIENKSIVDGKSKLLPFNVIDEFALFFYKKPYHTVDGATIKYVFDTGLDSAKNDLQDFDFNGPLEFAFESKDSGDKNLYGFVEYFGRRYAGFHISKSLEEYNKAGLEEISYKFGDNGLEIVREAFLNAIIHRDYSDNQRFTKVTFADNYIKIENPVSKKVGALDKIKNEFSNFSLNSFVVNPKLMRYFMLSNYCERMGHGFADFKTVDFVKLTLKEDYILETILTFKKQS